MSSLLYLYPSRSLISSSYIPSLLPPPLPPALELLCDLVSYEEVQQPILLGLITMLKHDETPVPKVLQMDGTATGMDTVSQLAW